ncbi:Holliday junction branch migration protein RuvA [Patescibacteria group bacterium]|nr:Holliday junction branch migration protein RuvA [Patescibacteria group bacterium]
MIRYIEGTVASISNSGAVILVGGLGYHVHTTKKTALLPNDAVSLNTYLAVRETALDLYGFVNPLELDCFELLLTIPKIGPKSALQILDQADVTLLLEAINLEDPAHLTKLSGISKKTAEKIVTELKGKVDLLSHASNSVAPEANTDIYNDAFDTLLTLGYNPINIRRVLESLDQTTTTSILVRQALQQLS